MSTRIGVFNKPVAKPTEKAVLEDELKELELESEDGKPEDGDQEGKGSSKKNKKDE